MKKIAEMGIGDISPTVLALVVAAMIAAAGLLALSGFQGSASMVADSAAYNATADAVTGVSEVTGQFPTIGIIVGVVIIIGIVVAGFYFKKR
ncbi:MAG: hypothetical protein ACTSYG_07590 [Candidatus Heimdallarchaeota archaeon]